MSSLIDHIRRIRREKVRESTKRLARHNAILLVAGLSFACLAILLQPFHSTSLWMQDQLFTPKSPSSNVIVAGIDGAATAKYGRLANWPRRLHAQAIDNLAKAGARVIAFDVLFADNSPDDEALAAAIKSAGNVVLPLVMEYSTQPDGPANGQPLLDAAVLQNAARTTGHVNITSDLDGVVRKVPLALMDGSGHAYPSFSLAVLYTMFSQQLPARYQVEGGSVRLLARDIPVDDPLNMRIDFSSRATDRQYISYGKIVDGEFNPALVRNKVVLIGLTAAAEDTWITPGSGKVPGAYIHAAAIDTILLERFYTDASGWTTFLTIVSMVLLLAVTLPRMRLALGAGVSFGLMVAYLGVTFASFDRGYVLNLLYPLSVMPFMFGSSLVAHAAIARSERKLVNGLFSRYVSPQVAREIVDLADRGQLNLKGELREVTVLFADMRGYTKMSESLSPEEVVETLNEHLSVIIGSVMQNGGMVNKFAGDNIMAVWGAPKSQADQAMLAVKAALEAQQGLARLRSDKPSLTAAQFGIGVNSGKAVVGNVGSAGRSEYTVIGDTVNLASRICSATPGGEVWIGPNTFTATLDLVKAEELGPQAFKGKSETVPVYRVVELKTA